MRANDDRTITRGVGAVAVGAHRYCTVNSATCDGPTAGPRAFAGAREYPFSSASQTRRVPWSWHVGSEQPLDIQDNYGHLEKLISMPISDLASVNIYESEREQSRIIRRQFCGERPVGAIFRGAHMSIVVLSSA